MTVRIVTNAQLSGNDQQTELEMLLSGGLESTLESSILLANVEPAMNIFTSPWRFANHDEAEAFADGPEGQRLLHVLEERCGIIGLAWGVNGFRQLTNSVRPVRAPADLQGLKIRVAGSGNFHQIFRTFGADPVTMNFGELVTALQTGAIEGQENPLSVIDSRRLYEVQDHLTIWNYTYDPIALCVNAGWFRSQSSGMQATLRDCAREAMAAQRVFSRTREAAMLEDLRGKMQVAELTPSEIAAFRAPFQSTATGTATAVTSVRFSWLAIGLGLLLAVTVLLVILLLVLNVFAAGRRRD
jgi:tripartite ATP-independent transporter DctP family solute receptor